MLAVLSPAKSLDFETPVTTEAFTQPNYATEAVYLAAKLRKMSARKLGKMMHISPQLAELNYERYQGFEDAFTTENARQALFAFKGDVYLGLQAHTFSNADLEYAQQHLRILSGLYGVLRPLDLMQPYRLEMGTSWAVTPKKKNLYNWWDKRISATIAEAMEQANTDVLLNVASNEYFKAVQPKLLKGTVISPVFLDRAKSGEFKAIMTFAKKARGLMAAWMVKNRVTSAADVPGFAEEGYTYLAAKSTPTEPVFVRG